jgi:hypothetical protein
MGANANRVAMLRCLVTPFDEGVKRLSNHREFWRDRRFVLEEGTRTPLPW